jgi:hypothetical protein
MCSDPADVVNTVAVGSSTMFCVCVIWWTSAVERT